MIYFMREDGEAALSGIGEVSRAALANLLEKP